MKQLLTLKSAQLFAFCFGLFTLSAAATETPTQLATPEGARFAILGEKPSAPAPTLFIFALDRTTTLQEETFMRVGHLLRQRGSFLCVSVDMPTHGDDVRPGEPNSLKGWRVRLDKNEDIVAPFAARTSLVLDYLIRERYTDPTRIAISGTSRGGFMALHFAAREPRIGAVTAFSPATYLPAVAEFKGLEEHSLTKSLSASALAGALAGRPIWMVIGNNDQRVGTDHCIAFARAVAAAGQTDGRISPVELHVVPAKNHNRPVAAYEQAASWVLATLPKPDIGR